jgi:hypothetical protein
MYLSVFDKHQLAIAKDTLKNKSALFALILGGPNHAESRKIVLRLMGDKPGRAWLAKYDNKDDGLSVDDVVLCECLDPDGCPCGGHCRKPADVQVQHEYMAEVLEGPWPHCHECAKNAAPAGWYTLPLK